MLDASSTLTVAIASGLLYGFLHGLGPDHCAAVLALAVRARSASQAARVGLRVGLSHAFGLSVLVLGSVALGVAIPARLERAFEITGGLLLVVLGAAIALRTDVAVRVHHHGEHRHDRWHAHLESRGSAAVVGGVFAASGARALVFVVSPMLAAHGSVLAGVAFVLAFACGVMLTMVVCTLALAALHRSSPDFAGGRTQRRLTRATGVVSSLLGLGWAVHAAWA